MSAVPDVADITRGYVDRLGHNGVGESEMKNATRELDALHFDGRRSESGHDRSAAPRQRARNDRVPAARQRRRVSRQREHLG
jgi:hypothetical protein